MTPYTLSDRSWIYRLANFGHCRIYYQTDICTLLRAIAAGAFALLLIATAASLLITIITVSLWNTFYMIVEGAEVLPTTIVFYGVLGAVVVIVIVEQFRRMIRYYRNKRRQEVPVPKEPGFISLAYQKFKNKTCVRIQFTPDGYDD